MMQSQKNIKLILKTYRPVCLDLFQQCRPIYVTTHTIP